MPWTAHFEDLSVSDVPYTGIIQRTSDGNSWTSKQTNQSDRNIHQVTRLPDSQNEKSSEGQWYLHGGQSRLISLSLLSNGHSPPLLLITDRSVDLKIRLVGTHVDDFRRLYFLVFRYGLKIPFCDHFSLSLRSEYSAT